MAEAQPATPADGGYIDDETLLHYRQCRCVLPVPDEKEYTITGVGMSDEQVQALKEMFALQKITWEFPAIGQCQYCKQILVNNECPGCGAPQGDE